MTTDYVEQFHGTDGHGRLGLVVGVGASAGGLEALQSFFSSVRPDGGATYVVIQHLSPDFKSVMAEILSRYTDLVIETASNGLKLLPNRIYLIPPNREMIVSDGRLLLRERDDSYGLSLPIDTFFRSLAAEYGRRCAGVILSGTGHDGTRGCQAIHDAGGQVVCQEPETAVFDGMPRSVLATGVVSASLAPERIPAFLLTIGQEQLEPAEIDPLDDEIDPVYAPVFHLLGERFGVEFAHYRTGTIGRRIDRRMRQRECSTIESYVKVLMAEPSELKTLYEDFLIGVTEMFRDPPVWEFVAERVMPKLFENLPEEEELRIWVPGTATGQEAYTVALLAHETALRANRKPLVRIFATDLHGGSIETASRGIYPVAAIDSLDERRQARYFLRLDDDTVQVSPDLRKMVVFARHDVMRDPPFMKLDMVTCRNMLIYLKPAMQQRVLSLLLFALRPEGCLVLGSSEGVGALEEEVDVVERRLKVFTKRRDASKLRLGPPRQIVVTGRASSVPVPVQRHSVGWARDQWLLRAYDTMLEDYAPPALLVDSAGMLLHTFGTASQWLSAPSGRTTNSIEALIRPELRSAVAAGLQRVGRSEGALTYGGIRVELVAGQPRMVRVTVRPLNPGRRDHGYLIVFEDQAALEPPEVRLPDDIETVLPNDAEHVEYLQAELRYAREQVQATVEELEASNEELQASNEELIASNEELQSTNEELHSVNEELYTVNREYEDSIERLTQLAGDLDNLMRSTDIGTIFVDDQLRIRRFTPAATRHINLLPADVGRPIVHLSRNIEVDQLDSILARVLNEGVPLEEEVRHLDGTWYLLRMHPYRQIEGDIAGVVMTFVDIAALKAANLKVVRRGEALQTFAYSVSHDLQRPVRMIVSFAELFERRCRDLLANDEALGYLDEVREGSRQVSRMLEALLEYSRIDSRGAVLAPISLNDILAEALGRLRPGIEEVAASITAEDLPVVLADAKQIVRIFVELIKNSLVFAGSRPVSIRVRAVPVEAALVKIEVLDNGIGVDDIERGRVFEMFHKLPGVAASDRLGVGLALVERIADRHGGTVGIGTNAEGLTSAWFTIPVADDSTSGPVKNTDPLVLNLVGSRL